MEVEGVLLLYPNNDIAPEKCVRNAHCLCYASKFFFITNVLWLIGFSCKLACHVHCTICYSSYSILLFFLLARYDFRNRPFTRLICDQKSKLFLDIWMTAPRPVIIWYVMLGWGFCSPSSVPTALHLVLSHFCSSYCIASNKSIEFRNNAKINAHFWAKMFGHETLRTILVIDSCKIVNGIVGSFPFKRPEIGYTIPIARDSQCLNINIDLLLVCISSSA